MGARSIDDENAGTSSGKLRACVGVDLGGSKVHVGAVDREGHVLAQRLAPTEVERGVEVVIASIAELAEECLVESGAEGLAVGIGVAGQIDTTAGVVRSSPNLPSWVDVDLAPSVAALLGIPAIAMNDLRAIAHGEWHFGAGRGVSDLVVLFIGTGVGGAVIAGGKPLLGAGGYAGELGHMPIVANGRKCHCPGRGCIEAYVSGWALAERFAEALALHPGHAPAFAAADGVVTARELSSAYAAGAPLAKALVRETADYLGTGLMAITNAFNPARIILGGGVIEGIPDLAQLAALKLRSDAILVSRDQVTLERSTLGSTAGVIGAASWAWDELVT
jgi:glucokinase